MKKLEYENITDGQIGNEQQLFWPFGFNKLKMDALYHKTWLNHLKEYFSKHSFFLKISCFRLFVCLPRNFRPTREFHSYGDVTITGEGLHVLTYTRHS